MAAYADHIVIMVEDEANLKNTIRNLLKNRMKMGLGMNDDKAKYMIITRNNSRVRHLDIVCNG
jgi:hypothetical protein